MEIVPDRSKETLLPIIGRICRPGTEIHSDEWGAYRLIQEKLGFEHKTVNHSACFVNPDNGVHTQNIESYWAKHKHMLKSMKGIKRGRLLMYLQECTWRDMVENHVFLNFLKLIEINCLKLLSFVRITVAKTIVQMLNFSKMQKKVKCL